MVIDELHEIFVARAEEHIGPLFFSPKGHRGHRVIGLDPFDAKDRYPCELAILVGPVELGEEIFWSPFAVHFIFGVDRLPRFFVIGSVEDGHKVGRREIADELLHGADKTEKGARRLALVVQHRANRVVGAEEVIDSVEDVDFFIT